MKTKFKKLEVLLFVIIAPNLLTLHSSSFPTNSVSETTLNLLKESTDFQNAIELFRFIGEQRPVLR